MDHHPESNAHFWYRLQQAFQEFRKDGDFTASWSRDGWRGGRSQWGESALPDEPPIEHWMVDSKDDSRTNLFRELAEECAIRLGAAHDIAYVSWLDRLRLHSAERGDGCFRVTMFVDTVQHGQGETHPLEAYGDINNVAAVSQGYCLHLKNEAIHQEAETKQTQRTGTEINSAAARVQAPVPVPAPRGKGRCLDERTEKAIAIMLKYSLNTPGELLDKLCDPSERDNDELPDCWESRGWTLTLGKRKQYKTWSERVCGYVKEIKTGQRMTTAPFRPAKLACLSKSVGNSHP